MLSGLRSGKNYIISLSDSISGQIAFTEISGQVGGDILGTYYRGSAFFSPIRSYPRNCFGVSAYGGINRCTNKKRPSQLREKFAFTTYFVDRNTNIGHACIGISSTSQASHHLLDQVS
jgi:hypothetical protein